MNRSNVILSFGRILCARVSGGLLGDSVMRQSFLEHLIKIGVNSSSRNEDGGFREDSTKSQI